MRLSAFSVLVALALVCVPPVTYAQVKLDVNGLERTVYVKSRALLIGVGTQDDPIAFPSISNVHEELDAVEAALKEQNFEVSRVRDQKRSDLYKSIKDFLAESSSDQTRAIIYFSGHGWTDDKLIGYIVPRDAPDPYNNLKAFRSKALSMTEIRALVNDADLKHLLVVFDSCFSGAVFYTRSPGLKGPNILQFEKINKRVKTFLTAGDETQKVPAINQFTPTFVSGIEGDADTESNGNGDGIVDIYELSSYLSDKITPNKLQTPRMGDIDSTTSNGVFIFVPPGRHLVTAELDPPRQVVPSVQQVRGIELGAPVPTPVASIDRVLQPEPVNAFYSGLDIRYYRKAADGDSLIRAMDTAEIPYIVTKAQRPETFRTNGIACHPDIPTEKLRKVLQIMTRAGFPVREIRQFREPQLKPNRIEILTFAQVFENGNEIESDNPPLSAAQIETLPGCVNFYNNVH